MAEQTPKVTMSRCWRAVDPHTIFSPVVYYLIPCGDANLRQGDIKFERQSKDTDVQMTRVRTRWESRGEDPHVGQWVTTRTPFLVGSDGFSSDGSVVPT